MRIGVNLHSENIFVDEYYNSIKNHRTKSQKDKDKYWDLSRVHEEDTRFMSGRVDNFLVFLAKKYKELRGNDISDSEELSDSDKSDDEEEKRSSEKKPPLKENYDQVLILLDDNKEYLGHIYVWSWLTEAVDYLNLFTLKFAGIRTSVRNLATRKVRKISTIMINIIVDWGKNHGYECIEVGLRPMGTMRDNLENCGFDDGEDIIYIDDIKCHPEKDSLQLMPITDVFHLEDPSFLERWYNEERIDDKELIQNMYFGSDIASDIHRIYKMTYPDRTPTKYELEYVYLLTFVDKYGYSPGDHLNDPFPYRDEKYVVSDVATEMIELKQIDKELSKFVDDGMSNSLFFLFKLKVRFLKFTLWYEKGIYSLLYNREIKKKEKDITEMIKRIRNNFYHVISDDSYKGKMNKEFGYEYWVKEIVSNTLMVE